MPESKKSKRSALDDVPMSINNFMRTTDPNEDDNQPPEKRLKAFSEEDKGIERLLDIDFCLSI